MGQKSEIYEFILEVLLAEILKDGEMDPEEREALDKIYPLLKISPARFLEIKEKVQVSVRVDEEAGSLDFVTLFRRINAKLCEQHDTKKADSMVKKIASVLGRKKEYVAFLKSSQETSDEDFEVQIPNKFPI